MYRNRELLPILDEHLIDDQQVVPHLVMADVLRWLVTHRLEQPELIRSVLEWLEKAYVEGDDAIRDVIAVSGVEMIPDPGQPGSDLRLLLGPHLTAVDPWPS